MSNPGGFVRVWRRSMGSEVFEDSTLWHVFSWCLLSAEWRDSGRTPRGSFRTKIRDAAESLRIPRSTFHRALQRLVDLGCITLASSQKKTVVSVCNWETYQPSEEPKTAWDKSGTKVGQSRDKSGTKVGQEPGQTEAPPSDYEDTTYDDGQAERGTTLGQSRDKSGTKSGQEWDKSGTPYKEEERRKKKEEGRRKNSGDAPTLIRVPWVDHLPEGELSFASARQRDGQPECFKVADSKIEEWQATWPSLNVRAELRKASQWLRDNPTRRKTPAGLLRFLSAWLERTVDRGGRGAVAQSAGATRSQRTLEAAQRYMATMGGVDV